ncbi:MAG: L-rhamnose mutarotase [Phycisphaerales bacterium]|nr:L-rhamnose mutarotase [Phycisphaerales bacterium]
MRSFAQCLDLVDDPRLIEAYDDLHRRVWPEVVQALRSIGVERMRIFRRGTRLFMYMETTDGFDPARDYQAYADQPRCREWDEQMRRFQRQVPGAPPDSWWAPMALVFDLEGTD